MLFACLALILALCAVSLQLAFRLRVQMRRFAELQKQYVDMQEARNLLLSHAYFDHLTGLANRSLLEDRFHLAIERAKRNQLPFALVMIDLNNFKQINDALGHLIGDQILVEVSRRLVDTVRASDTVARFGGDEFVLIVESIEKGLDFGHIGAKLIEALSERVTLDNGKVVSIGASIGYAAYPSDGLTLTDMLAVADRAMYDCKTSGLTPLF